MNTGNTAPVNFPTFGNDTTQISIPTGLYDYVAFHWGGQGNYQAFYIGDFLATEPSFTFNAPTQNGLSWYAMFRARPSTGITVPDFANSAALLLVSLAGMALVRLLGGVRRRST